MKLIDKKILIISHNPLSGVNNNGKTLTSIFKGHPNSNIYQIYLNYDIPDYSDKCHYLQLNEKQILSSIIHGKNICCQEIHAVENKVSSSRVKKYTFANHSKRLVRECVWKASVWKEPLNDWLKDKRFDVVFFMAGDGLFAYDVYQHVMNHVSAKGCIFFTDDYIIGKISYSPVAAFRRFLLKNKVQKTLANTNELYVISEEMREAYHNIFHKESCVIRNFSVEKKVENPETQWVENSEHLTMVYAGGLHYNRWKVLAQIANALVQINNSNQKKCFLKIYSAQTISGNILERLTVEGASKFCGGASASQISDIYANADILLHVESFDKKAIASTKYSFSTKIPEYLSAGKCVLAVGPAEVASLRYLSDMACVASKNSDLSSVLTELINNEQYRKSIQLNCEKYYKKDFSENIQKECLNRILSIV